MHIEVSEVNAGSFRFCKSGESRRISRENLTARELSQQLVFLFIFEVILCIYIDIHL